MKKQLQGVIIVLSATITLMTSMTVSAQNAGNWSVKAGISQIMPKVDSGDMSAPVLPGTKVDVTDDSTAVIAASYMFTDNLSAEFQLSNPYTHALEGDGSIKGVGKLGRFESFPPALFVQWRFLEPKATFRPYIGLGLTYARFQKETGSGALTALTNTGSATPTTFTVDSKFGITPQAGVTYAINDKLFADLAVAKTYLKTTTHFSTGQKLDIRLDPLAVSLAIGYRF
ncbi:MAG: OmpW family outer membrane protein [Oxalobacteraceae bacterium]|nr:OmpW family outer membrane protein [Oxalobacteraceae bacterium]